MLHSSRHLCVDLLVCIVHYNHVQPYPKILGSYRTNYFLSFPNNTVSISCPFRTYLIPAALAFPHGLYALIGHQSIPGTAPIPPGMRPVPLHPDAISDLGTPHVGHESDAAADGDGCCCGGAEVLAGCCIKTKGRHMNTRCDQQADNQFEQRTKLNNVPPGYCHYQALHGIERSRIF